ncbi:7580_t:CDS:2 [Funneliformis geosporum]|uniref:12948_t:CDS:1 n=1 Tax=Funneliformis geosporum TaxID=1117311 RepID=A0A9W4WWQ9_9GLOM|nr:7580_t:CDS:2 [Funneliformis geosporum]CAI2177901.1 12948_t:CDS:2 [Funneliformis geosporum]
MSLVADYGSDASSSEEETNVQIVTETMTNTKKPLLSSLPKSKRNGPVKIMVDLPKFDNDENDDIDDKQGSRKSKLSSSGGSGLFALLPAPKRLVTSKQNSTNKSVSSSTIKSTTVSTRAEITNIIQSKVENESSNTINLDKTESPNIESNVTTESFATNDYYYNYQWDTGTNSYTECYYDESQTNSEQAQPDNQIDDEAIQKLGGRRGKEGPIIIKEISAADQMADAWQAQMGELTKPGKVGGGIALKPTKGQKRKHNLMYLAYQASAMENDLKEQFAANKKTKRETQAKYGF